MKYRALTISACIWSVVFLLIKVYRPYIFSNGINDYYMAGSFPSVLYPAGVFFLGYQIWYKKITVKKLLWATIWAGYIFELADVLVPPHNIDIPDLIALSIGSVFCYWLVMNKKVQAFFMR